MTPPSEPARRDPVPPRASVGPPAISRRSTPRFGTRERREELASAFTGQGLEYDRLRPGYPAPVLDAIMAALPPGARVAADLGAGTGKLSRALAARGLDVFAVDPSATMLEAALLSDPADATDAQEGAGSLTPRCGTAEATGLPDASCDLVTAAQAWHWFDVEAACAEVRRILRPDGLLALLWNTLDVQIPWVHRYSRIMHAGDVQREDFTPPVTPDLRIEHHLVHRWEDPRTTGELVDLAGTRSYVITAPPERRERVRANLDWYLHEHLGHTRGGIVGMPYRTDLFLLRPAPGR